MSEICVSLTAQPFARARNVLMTPQPPYLLFASWKRGVGRTERGSARVYVGEWRESGRACGAERTGRPAHTSPA